MTNPNESEWWIDRITACGEWADQEDADGGQGYGLNEDRVIEEVRKIVTEAERRTWEEADTVLCMTYLADGITYGRDERCEKMFRLLISNINAKLSPLTKK